MGSEGHHADHPHAHGPRNRAEAAFRWSVLLNAALTTLQLTIGFAFGSLALIGDALHNLGDVVGLALGWGAERLSRRPATGRFTYGFGRSTHLASLVNGLLIFAAGAVVVVEAIQRFLAPVPLQTGPVAWAAAAGIVINLLSARLFGHDHHHDLNQRAAVLHLLTDAAVSVAVLASTLLVGATGWLQLDALTAFGVGAVVMASAWSLLREAIAVNLDAAPRGIDVERVRAALLALPGVVAVPELHIWGVSTSRTALTAHVLRQADAADDANAFLEEARRCVGELGIRKSTLEVEVEVEEGTGS
ncbi:cation diffusion facilitator family transporter [Cyanobium sp. FGCU-52]|nr:cation diffusion facilitator family transporter [Cyanobium sp. FGCU52]